MATYRVQVLTGEWHEVRTDAGEPFSDLATLTGSVDRGVWMNCGDVRVKASSIIAVREIGSSEPFISMT